MELTVGAAQRWESKFNIGLYEAVQSTLRGDEVLQARVIARECRRVSGAALDECTRQVVSDMALMVNRVREDRVRSVTGLERLLDGLALVDAPKSLVLMSEGLVVTDESDVDGIVRAAARARASVNVLMMDVVRGGDVARGPVMPPTMTEDRDLQTNGLRDLAAASRGSLFNVVGDGMLIFERLASELSAYYLVGVEEEPGDRNDRAHRIDVEVRRQGVTLRSRRALVLAAPRTSSPADRLGELLRAPFGVAEMPLRVSTFSVQDDASSRVRLLLAAEVDQAGSPEGTYSVAWMLTDREGRVVTSGSERRTLTPSRPDSTGALEFRTEALVDPGVYSLRVAVIDESGRRGALVREINAWKMAGEDFAVADLVVGAAPQRGQTLLASVEPQLEEHVAAVVELYATSPETFGRTVVTFEIDDTEDSAPLLTAGADIIDGSGPTSRTAQAVIGAQALPAGRYLVRARVQRDGVTTGLLTRPFILRRTTTGPPAMVTPPVRPVIAPFDRARTLAPALISDMFTTVEARFPGLRSAFADARAGRYGAASLEALGEGHQDVAALFKGLDLYTRGQLDQAATQFNLAAGARREFFPAAFFLGATLAAAGRDRDAASVWQLAIGTEPRPAVVYALFADARLRDGQAQSVVDVLQPVWERSRTDDEVGRRLAAALVLTGKFAEALPVFEGYLNRHPDDQDTLASAVMTQYEATTRAGLGLSTRERERLSEWLRRYTGPQRALLNRFADALP